MTAISRKKVLFLITKSNWGGAQRYVYDLATHLDPMQFEVVVALGGTGRLREELAAAHIRTISLSYLERDVSIAKECKAAAELFSILKTEKPDILHINSSKAGGLGTLLGRIVGIKRIIFTAHGWAFNEDRPLWQRCIIRTLHWITVLLAHTTITVSNTTRAQLHLPFGTHRMVTIHNGRTSPVFKSRDDSREFFITHIPALQQYPHDFWSVTIGELHPVKGHDVTIQAFAEVVKEFPHTRHIIIGDGEERARLESLVVSLSLSSHVFFAGHIHEASQYLKAFEAFILSSKSEALAYVIIEACLAQLPIIASNVGGIPEIITHERSGLLFTQGNTTELAAYIMEIQTDSHLRESLGKNALLTSHAFSLEQMVEKMEALY